MKPFDCTGYSVVYEGQLSEAQTDAITALVTNAIETQDEFIFQTLRPFCEKQVNMVITKEELIQALNLYREQKEKGSGWISVEDRLPDPPCYCLIYTPEKGYGCDGVMAATYTDYGWMTPVYYPDPTHWRPMPEKPEEVVEDADGA